MATIFFIGIGNMGFPMAMNLLRAGHAVAVLDRDPDKVAAAAHQGARPAATAADGIREADYVFISVPTSDILVEVVTGSDGIGPHLTAGQTVVDLSTVSVAASRTCAATIEGAGATFLRCPVNGSVAFAEAGTLTMIISGPEDVYQRTLPLLEQLSTTRFYIGEAEQARLMKLAVNTIIATYLEIFAEAAVLCRKGGIDWNTALDVFAGSSISSPQLRFKLEALRQRDFTPTSFATTVVKDSTMAIEAAKELGVYVPITAATLQMYEACVARGNGRKDYAVVLEAVEAMSGLDSPGV
ncbi:MAG: NAD(P)-dependent oxidoreductase [Planctomycetes bacterium]|nr:NAD(P)-dependent oxidoreductase [Planctomycetota bacterium]